MADWLWLPRLRSAGRLSDFSYEMDNLSKDILERRRNAERGNNDEN